MNKQCTSNLLMVEPVAFAFNKQTAVNNFFQQNDDLSDDIVHKKALEEFLFAVERLRSKQINVLTIKSLPDTPDAIFPNNRISLHEDGTVILYPMYAPNRRKEIRSDVLETLINNGFLIKQVIDYSKYNPENTFLEGTGSMVFDRINKIVYATLSERTSRTLLHRFCRESGFEPCVFNAVQTIGNQEYPIYHTNVMMSIANNYAVVCMDSVHDITEKEILQSTLEKSGKKIIRITEKQMNHFAGNCLQVENIFNKNFLVISNSGYHSLSGIQKEEIESHNEILPIPVPTIEKYGGGSIRCMIAENFLPFNLIS